MKAIVEVSWATVKMTLPILKESRLPSLGTCSRELKRKISETITVVVHTLVLVSIREGIRLSSGEVLLKTHV